MNKAKNAPGLQVGDKIRIIFKRFDEHGNSENTSIGNIGIVTKVNSRYFYTTEEFEEGDVMKTSNTWKNVEFQKDGDIWIATINVGKIRGNADATGVDIRA